MSPGTRAYNQKNLAVRYFPGSHTGQATAVLVKDVLLSYGVPLDRVLYAVTDNASNMETCVNAHMDDAPTLRIYCAAHWLQLGVNDALKECGTVDAIEHLKDYIAYVGRSTAAAERLEQLQREKYPDRESRKLVKDVETRWCSTFFMCETVDRMELAIVAHLLELIQKKETRAVTSLCPEDFQEIKYMVSFLRPFYDATMALEGDNDASISVIFPQLQKILYKLDPARAVEMKPAVVEVKNGKRHVQEPAVVVQTEDVPENMMELREMLRIKLAERWGAESKVHHLFDLYVGATYLDHRYRDFHIIKKWKQQGLNKIERMAVDMMKHESYRIDVDGAGAAGGGGGGTHMLKCTTTKMTQVQMDHLYFVEDEEEEGDEEDGDGERSERLTEGEMSTNVLRELERYGKEKISFSSMSQSPLEWWASYSASFPILSRLAARILSIPASSASCERVFSQAGLTLTKLRTRLGKKTVEDLMMIKYHHQGGVKYVTMRDWQNMKDEEETEKEQAVNDE